MTRLLTCWLLLALATHVDAGPAAKKLNWNKCYEDIAANFAPLPVRYECTQANVPLDHDRPNGPAISIALVRLPASDPDIYRGSLFLNPGGPGGSGVDFALFFGPFAPFVLGPVANQYDIVGFDPRGIARSTPLRCFGNLNQAFQAFSPVPFPFDESEVPLFEAANGLLNNQCTQRGNKILEHMSTANVAKDLDLLRQAVGDDQLNYLGLSYGSYLGQTYANLFPNNVGALVIDGILDPIAWANVNPTVPFSVALRSDKGAQDTLDEFLRQCEAAGAPACALAPNAASRLDALLERLRAGPIQIIDPSTGATFDYLYSFGVLDLLLGLYNSFGYADLAGFFAFLETIPEPAALGLARAEMQRSVGLVNKRGFPNYPNFAESFPGVGCADTSNPAGGHDVWFAAGKAATADFGIFGEAWTWAAGPCAVWTSFDNDVYKGPFDTSTANPVLVIGNFYDPATRYEGALKANNLLANSVLLSVDEPGHTSLGLSGCAGFFTGLYLEDPNAFADLLSAFLPGGTCPSEGNWFTKFGPAASADSGMGASFRTRLMEQIAFRP